MRRFVFFALVVLGSACQCGPPAHPDSGQPDAGDDSDAGADASVDAGPDGDAGDDAGSDAAVDAGDDAGLDAGDDAGDDAGADAGFDAGNAGRADAGGCWLPDGVGAPFRVRAVAANLSSGNRQSYDPGEGQRILQGVSPDVVLIQEFNYGANSTADLDTFTTATLDGGFWYRGSGQIPNGVLSRWPLIAAGEWVDPRVGNRTFAWALIDLPGPRDLYVVSVHLLTTTAGERGQEATALLAQLSANVPPADFLVIAGDFNTDSRGEVALSTLAARMVTTGPFPADQQGNSFTSSTRTRPYDWVIASPCLDRLEVPVAIGASSLDAGLVVDTRVYVPISDLAPALVTDSAANSMQHMAVVRDFLVQP